MLQYNIIYYIIISNTPATRPDFGQGLLKVDVQKAGFSRLGLTNEQISL